MDINLGQIALQLLNFGLLVLLLTKFLYRPIVKSLDDRTKKIQAGLKAAEDSLAERAKLEIQKQQALIKAQKQAAAILDQSRQDADRAGKDIVAQAQTAAQKAAQKQYQLMEEKIIQERHQLKQDIAKLVVDTTKAVLAGSLTKTHQQTIINHQIQKLKSLPKS